MNKLYTLITWHNGTTPALNEDNLNAMSEALDGIDDRVIELGGDILEVIPEIQTYLSQAEDLVEALETLSQNPPYIGANGNWYVWDTNTSQFVDSGVDASITVNIADITMLLPDATPYVTNTGTNTDPIFHLFIPRGQTGSAGNGIVSITKTGSSGNVDTYTILYTNGNTDTFTVTNGTGGVSNLSQLHDVDLTSLANGQILKYNSSDQEWHNADMVEIDDSTTSASKVWSSDKTNTELSSKAADTQTFTEAATRANIASGETMSTLFGKIKKYFTDMKNGAYIDTVLTSAVTGAVGATSVTITDANIHTTSIIEAFADNGTSTGMPEPTYTVTEGQCILGFDALEASTSFKLRVTN